MPSGDAAHVGYRVHEVSPRWDVRDCYQLRAGTDGAFERGEVDLP